MNEQGENKLRNYDILAEAEEIAQRADRTFQHLPRSKRFGLKTLLVISALSLIVAAPGASIKQSLFLEPQKAVSPVVPTSTPDVIIGPNNRILERKTSSFIKEVNRRIP